MTRKPISELPQLLEEAGYRKEAEKLKHEYVMTLLARELAKSIKRKNGGK